MNNNPQTIVPLSQPLTGSEALFKQLELLGRNTTDRPHTVIKVNNKIIYGSKLVELISESGDKYLDLEVLELNRISQLNPETGKKEPIYHIPPNDSCKIFRFADSKNIQRPGFEFLESLALQGQELFLIPNYIPLSLGDNGIGANFVSEYPVFFVEADDISIEEQWERINWFFMLTGLMPLMVVFSGGKSLHVFYSLDTPLTDRATWQRIQRKLILVFHSDFQIQNPNREMRLAGVTRASKNSTQLLQYYSNLKYSAAEFENKLDSLGWFPHGLTDERWLLASSDYYRVKNDKRSAEQKEVDLIKILAIPVADLYPKPKSRQKIDYVPTGGNLPIPLEECLSRANKERLNGVRDGSRNKTGHEIACDLIGCEQYLIDERIPYTGNAEDLFYSFCRACDQKDWLQSEWLTIWRSASSSKPTPSANWKDRDGLARKIHFWRIDNDSDYRVSVNYRKRTKNGFSKKLADSVAPDRPRNRKTLDLETIKDVLIDLANDFKLEVKFDGDNLTPESIEQIEREVSILDVVQRHLPVRKAGKHYVAQCCFHNDNVESLIIDPVRNIYYCNDCGVSGGIVKFLLSERKVPQTEAQTDSADLNQLIDEILDRNLSDADQDLALIELAQQTDNYNAQEVRDLAAQKLRSDSKKIT